MLVSMRKQPYLFGALLIITIVANAVFSQKSASPDVVFVPTNQKVVDAMLELAKVSKNDVVYDLGCGDGRIVTTAAEKFGASGVGIEIDAKLVALANENAEQRGVADRVKFVEADLFKTNYKPATVVMLYLSPSVNLRLRPRLLKQLKPGTRIVSHDFGMGEWEPERTIKIDEATLYLWTVPAKKPVFK